MTADAGHQKKTRKKTSPLWLAIRGAALILLAIVFLDPRTGDGLFLSFILGAVGIAVAATGIIRGAQHGWTS